MVGWSTAVLRWLTSAGAEWDGYGTIPGRRQELRIDRHRELLKRETVERKTAYGLTSLSAVQAGAERIAVLVRGHWEIENRLHDTRDFSCDENRCSAHVPRNLANLSNTAISLIRQDRRFNYLPEAHRHFTTRSDEALNAVMK